MSLDKGGISTASQDRAVEILILSTALFYGVTESHKTTFADSFHFSSQKFGGYK